VKVFLVCRGVLFSFWGCLSFLQILSVSRLWGCVRDRSETRFSYVIPRCKHTLFVISINHLLSFATSVSTVSFLVYEF
jgi:hypothetical protein